MNGCAHNGETSGDKALPTAGAAAATPAGLEAPDAGKSTPVGINFVRKVAAEVEPAVVTVHTLSEVERKPMTIEEMIGGGGRTSVRRGAGSGVIINADGYIITNDHVISGAQRMTVEVGGTGYDARLIGTDPATDIAVVKFDPPPGMSITTAKLGDSDTVQVGDWAIAIGDPLDVGATVTLGIISAIGERGPQRQDDSAPKVLQTDAAINPGNSGGALVNSDGQVIGINEAILSPTGSFVGIGFAIPINDARKIASDLIKLGRVVRPYLGISYVSVKSIPPAVRADNGISTSLAQGVVVAQVAPGSPAAEAGLQPRDVITSVDGQALTDQKALNKLIVGHAVGDSLTLQVQRGNSSQTVKIVLRERPASFAAPQRSEP